MAGVQVKQEAGRVRKGTPTNTQTDRGALEIQRVKHKRHSGICWGTATAVTSSMVTA